MGFQRTTRFLSLIAIVISTSHAIGQTSNQAEQLQPNIVLINVDDMGYADIGLQGAEQFETPNIDALAAGGVRFTDFYVSQPVCSASRASLLIGCYANRIGIHGALAPSSRIGIHEDEVTLAELCKSKGYATAIFGKWHLGHLDQFLPKHHGFDVFSGIPYSNDMWPGHPENPKAWGDLPTYRNGEIVGYNTDQSKFTTDFANQAIAFIQKHKDEPFFVYVAHPMPHVPLYVSDALKGSSEQGLYGDVIQEIDWSVGAIRKTLELLGLERKTLFIFVSDNGPWLSYGNHAGSTGPLREGKGTTFEGGVRVPCVMSWPGVIPNGHICHEPAMTIDVLPTIASLISAELPEHVIDGKNIWPLITGKDGATSPHESLFFWYRRNEMQAMRSGKWKLHFPHSYRSMIGREIGQDGMPGKYDYSVRTELSLYDLDTDIGEEINLAATHPEVVQRLLQAASAMKARLGDSLTKTKGSENRAPGRATEVDQESESNH